MWINTLEKNEKHATCIGKQIGYALAAMNETAHDNAEAISYALAAINEKVLANAATAMQEYEKRVKILGKHDFRILTLLIDDEGHAGREIKSVLDIDKATVSRAMTKMEKLGIIYRGQPRPSRNKQARHKRPEKNPEIPVYINKELENIYRLQNIVDYRINKDDNHSQVLKTLSTWLAVTLELCLDAGEEIRLAPKPFTPDEIRALILGYWPYHSAKEYCAAKARDRQENG